MKSIKKDNNEGFTLIELIIAIVVIAIVMGPMYHNFIESTIINGKAKAAMGATDMASNVMEGLSAYSADEIIKGFYCRERRAGAASTLNILPNDVTVQGTYGDVVLSGAGASLTKSKGFNSSTFTVSQNSYDYTGAAYVTAFDGTMDVKAPEQKYLKVKEASDSKYYFYAESLKQARGTYDVLLELDGSAASGYSGDLNDNGVIEAGTETESYNDKELAKFTRLNQAFDAVYKEDNTLRSTAANTFIANYKIAGTAVDADDLYSIMARNLTLEIDRDPADGNAVKVNVKEEYQLSGATIRQIDAAGNFTGSSFTTSSVLTDPGATYGAAAQEIFDQNAHEEQLPRNIYVYYRANYFAQGSAKDNFIIDNKAGIAVNVYLIRLVSPETTVPREAGYSSTLTIKEPVASGATPQVRVYSNLRDDLKTPANNAANRVNRTRCATYINSSVIRESNDPLYLEVVHENGGVPTETRDRMYTIKMYVYQEGAAAAGFPDDMKITDFTGTTTR